MKKLFDTTVNIVAVILLFCYIDMKVGGINNIIDYLDNEICNIKKKCSD